MKKQVLSFEEFILESYKMISEGASFSDAKQKLSEYLDEQGNKALANLEKICKMNSVAADKITEETGSLLTALADKFSKGDKISIEKIQLDVQPIVYKNMIQGKVYLGDVKGEFIRTYANTDNKKQIKINDLVGSINLSNISSKRSGMVLSDGKWLEKDGVVLNSGISGQLLVTDSSSEFEFVKSKPESPVKAKAPVPEELAKTVEGSKKLKEVNYSLVLYTIQKIELGEGNPIEASEIIEQTIEVGSGDTEQNLDILDNGTLFDLNKSILKDDGKKNIRLALGGFSSIASIEVIGGASKEGPAENNKKLCANRAKAVADFLKKEVTPDVEVNVSKEANIQTEESTDDLKTWRKVTLKVKGTTITQGEPKKVVTYKAVDKEMKADKVTLAQIVMGFKVKKS